MEIVFSEKGVVVRKSVEMMGEEEIHSKELTYDELEERQLELTIRSIDVERFENESLRTITLGDTSPSDTADETQERAFIDHVSKEFGLKKGTAQYNNVTGVVQRIKQKEAVNKTTWNEAVKEQVKEALKEDPSRDEDSYHYAVRDACVRRQGYKGDGAVREFLDDVKKIIDDYTSK